MFKICGSYMPVFYSILCVPTLHINHDRNGDVLLNSLISDFITLCVKNHMRRKALETQDFYEFSFCSNIIVSTCLVPGNISTAAARTAR